MSENEKGGGMTTDIVERLRENAAGLDGRHQGDWGEREPVDCAASASCDHGVRGAGREAEAMSVEILIAAV